MLKQSGCFMSCYQLSGKNRNELFSLIWFLLFNIYQVLPTIIPWVVPGLLNFLHRKTWVHDVQHRCGCESDHSCLPRFQFLRKLFAFQEN